jgi:hypothetical protein
MGYTHYNYRDKRSLGSLFMFEKLANDAKKIIAQAEADGISIHGWDGTGEPEFAYDVFRLNGDASQGLDHETFTWQAMPEQPEWWAREHGRDSSKKHRIFDFCKTAYKPYDAVVTAILLRAKVIYGKCVEVSSDGNWDDWKQGRDLYEKVFGESAPVPFEGALV